jgi:exodeoxyribonuclease VII large subunit
MTQQPISVTELNRHVRAYLEHEMGEVCVEGEISNLSKPSSGHVYFTLKDTAAQIRCVYFRNRHVRADEHTLQNGQQVNAIGKLSLYEARGDYQLIVDVLNDAGLGDLYRQFELLKTKLAAMGLFDAARKKAIPLMPTRIGIITSANAAALHDMLTTLARRFPLAPIVVYTSDVQGREAPGQLIDALQRAQDDNRCDVLILARGGGSLEDLWAFNNEQLAYAIADCVIPIVSGIGHETDFTIADFVADLRAATPTAAAESVAPDARVLLARLQVMQSTLTAAMTRYIQHKKVLLNHAVQKITSPGKLIVTHWQTLDYLETRLHRALHQAMLLKQHQLTHLITRLHAKHPGVRLHLVRATVLSLEQRLIQQMRVNVAHLQQRLATCCATLHAVSPLATLDRGYAIVSCHDKIVMDPHQVQVSDVVSVRLAKGTFTCEVTHVG